MVNFGVEQHDDEPSISAAFAVTTSLDLQARS